MPRRFEKLNEMQHDNHQPLPVLRYMLSLLRIKTKYQIVPVEGSDRKPAFPLLCTAISKRMVELDLRRRQLTRDQFNALLYAANIMQLKIDNKSESGNNSKSIIVCIASTKFQDLMAQYNMKVNVWPEKSRRENGKRVHVLVIESVDDCNLEKIDDKLCRSVVVYALKKYLKARRDLLQFEHVPV